MKILVIGGVAAGTKTAAKLKREDRAAEVTVLAKDKDISYAGCGLPYYVGGVIADKASLIVNTFSTFSVPSMPSSFVPVKQTMPLSASLRST